ncbi:CBS domain-containing protein [Streptomyces sp. NPDC007205]|uniref:CBS domain-containing protein n=1 Tax=Streptomyces sp. NPDC007205 TaxID=3154316 RepID=UPI0033DF8C33
MKVAEEMTVPPVCVPPGVPLAEVARQMAEYAVGSVLVVEDGELCGIVTDRDLAVRGVGNGLSVQARVESVMSSQVVSVGAADDLQQAYLMFRRTGVRRLPVLAAGRVVGVLTVDDLFLDRLPAPCRPAGTGRLERPARASGSSLGDASMSPSPARQRTAAVHGVGPPKAVAATVPAPELQDVAASVTTLDVPAVFTATDSSPRGLTTTEAALRRGRYGSNELPGVKRGQVWRRLVAQFTDLFAVVLLVSAAITFLAYWLGRPRDPATLQLALAILGVVLLNAGIGFTRSTPPSARRSPCRAWCRTPAACCATGSDGSCPPGNWCPATWWSWRPGTRCRPTAGWSRPRKPPSTMPR